MKQGIDLIQEQYLKRLELKTKIAKKSAKTYKLHLKNELHQDERDADRFRLKTLLAYKNRRKSIEKSVQATKHPISKGNYYA